MVLPSRGGHQPIRWGPEWNKMQRKEGFALVFPPEGLHSLLPSVVLLLRPSDLDWNIRHRPPWFSGLWTCTGSHHQLPWASSWPRQILGLLSRHNCVSQFLITESYCFCASGEGWLIQASKMSFQNFYWFMSPQNGHLSIVSHPSYDNSPFLYCDKSLYHLAPAHFSKLISHHKRAPLFLIIQLHWSFLSSSNSSHSFPTQVSSCATLLAGMSIPSAIWSAPIHPSDLRYHWQRRSFITAPDYLGCPWLTLPRHWYPAFITLSITRNCLFICVTIQLMSASPAPSRQRWGECLCPTANPQGWDSVPGTQQAPDSLLTA